MKLRPATFADEKLLLDWRNDPTVLEVSSNPLPVTPESHKAWLFNLMRDNETHLYIAEVCGYPVGQGRIERAWKAISKKMDSCVIGYSIVCEDRGKGYGIELVTELVKRGRASGYHTVSCRIKRGNVRSLIVAHEGGVDAVEFF